MGAIPTGNASAYSVSELAFAMKRTIEDAYGFVRVRGEISKVTRHASGHIYLTLKDDKAAIDGVVWKGSVRGLKCQPQQGLEVIITGRITTYPARSQYQIVIETMEPAGVGALLAQLERLKAKLAAEGLFEAARKQALPPMPSVIGVVTSPTGAVIRDILHRIRDRWPVHVIVWPVVVQGDGAAAQVIAAIEGFNAIVPGGPMPRPDLLIVARGGGSVEDLWPFNDEALARAAAASAIPLISAVGHETDTTLIDFVSDRRAPTPTAAAEMATPVLSDLRAAVLGLEQRMTRTVGYLLERSRNRLVAAARGMPNTDALLAIPTQSLDRASARLSAGRQANVAAHERAFARVAGRLSPLLLQRPQARLTVRLAEMEGRMGGAVMRQLDAATHRARLPELEARLDAGARRWILTLAERLERLDQLRRSLDPDGPLVRGFARVHRADGSLVRAAAGVTPGEAVALRFGDGERAARIEGEAAPPAPKPASPKSRTPTALTIQGNLF